MSISPKLLNRVSNIVAMISRSSGQSGSNPTVVINRIRRSGGLLAKLSLLKTMSVVLVAFVLILLILLLFVYWQLPEPDNSAITSEELSKIIQAKVQEEIKQRSLEDHTEPIEIQWFVESEPGVSSPELKRLGGSIVVEPPRLASDEKEANFSRAELSTQDETIEVSNRSEMNTSLDQELVINFGLQGLQSKLVKTRSAQ